MTDTITYLCVRKSRPLLDPERGRSLSIIEQRFPDCQPKIELIIHSPNINYYYYYSVFSGSIYRKNYRSSTKHCLRSTMCIFAITMYASCTVMNTSDSPVTELLTRCIGYS